MFDLIISSKPIRERRGLTSISALAGLLASVIAAPSFGSPFDLQFTEEDFVEERIYSPHVDRNFPDQVFFGDTHFHTKVSFDAGLVGTSLDIHEAFRVARGERITSNTGQPVQLIRPLDFLAVTEHAELNGLATGLQTSDPLLLEDAWGRWVYDKFNSGSEGRMEAFQDILQRSLSGENPFDDDELSRSIWVDSLHVADGYNDPGTFTAMMGFEWSATPGGDNLHRVVLFADGADKTSQTLPFSMFESDDPQDLWKYMQAYETRVGGQVLAIPHNGNLSNGLMFSGKTMSGQPIDEAYAKMRARWEPLHEMTQIKGDEETHPVLSPNDEFADFENWDVSNITGSAAKKPEMLQNEYARSALKIGLKLEAEIGTNPFKFGMIGATDAHTALPTSREENYFGKYAHSEPSADRHNRDVIPADDPALRILTAQESAAGLMAVWARTNTRKDLFGAMKRKEVYATTGTRIRVRVFGGWDFSDKDMSRPDFVDQGYGRGVPMGGDLRDAPENSAPQFLIRALRDPDGANLDRVQVIKGWLDDSGELHERIYDVAVSDDRTIGDDGRAGESVGNSVNIAEATYTNSIGAPMLQNHWFDPDFDPAESAFYYVRVLEIPTPRWTTYDAAFFDIPLPDTVPPTVQDRAYTSPIWYTPEK